MQIRNLCKFEPAGQTAYCIGFLAMNMNLRTDKLEFKTSFPSRWYSRLTFPSVWTGKLDGKVRTGNSFAPGFILDEFSV